MIVLHGAKDLGCPVETLQRNLLIGRKQIIPDDLEVTSPESAIGFDMIAFAPLIPGFQEDNSVILRYMAHHLECSPQMFAE
jgi:hypothetical protein